MKPWKLSVVCLILLSNESLHAQLEDKRNYVSPSDTNLKIDHRYNNAMRTNYHVGFNAGADISTSTGGIFGEFTASYSPKRFLFRANYAFDLSGSDLFSKSNLYEKGNKYSKMSFSAIFNWKDKIEDVKLQPTVGIDVIDQSRAGDVVTTNYYSYKTDYSYQKRTTTGVGVSYYLQGANCFYNQEKVDTTKEFITLANNQPLPNEFILPYRSGVIGIGIHMGTFTGYKTFFQYKNLRKTKMKANFFSMSSFELLFAPSISTSDLIYYNASNGNIMESAIQDVKKRPFGFRVGVTTNSFKKFVLKPGFYLNGEVGMRPGISPTKRSSDSEEDSKLDDFVQKIASNPFYMKFGIGFAF